ncbi:MAG: DUF2752 domain-containing protein [Acidobacteria bacterium]|nr:DUF2752 domain-containing protein [Acidobacteriota bacterium]
MDSPSQATTPPGSSPATALVVWLGGALLAVAVVAWLAALGPGETTICLFRHWTGVPCPGCGVTRSIAALVRGDVSRAFHLHPLAPIAAAEAGILWVGWGVSLFSRRRGLDESRLALVLLANFAAFVALWVVRVATGTLPE